MADKKIRVAIVGLGFGAEFIPIYQAHPNAEMYADLPAQQDGARQASATSSASRRYTDYDELLKDPNIDAVHINCPIPDHAPQSDRGAQGRQARRLHRADGHHASTSAGRSSRRSGRAARST